MMCSVRGGALYDMLYKWWFSVMGGALYDVLCKGWCFVRCTL